MASQFPPFIAHSAIIEEPRVYEATFLSTDASQPFEFVFFFKCGRHLAHAAGPQFSPPSYPISSPVPYQPATSKRQQVPAECSIVAYDLFRRRR